MDWAKPAPGGRAGNISGVEAAPELAAANSVNAVAVAEANAKRVSHHKMMVLTFHDLTSIFQALKRRLEVFKKFSLPDALGDGRITSMTPLCIADEETSSYGGYGIEVSPTLKQFVVCKGQSSYG